VATPFAFIPVCTFFAALALLALIVVVLGAYNRTDNPSAEETRSQEWQLTWQWVAAIIITIVVPALMLLLIWLLPEGDQ